MLAAVAALIGSFIAAAFANPFNATLFRVGMLTYAGYLAVFPGFLGLTSSNGQIAETTLSFEAQQKRFREALYPEKVSEIVGDRVKNARKRYERWRHWVALAYVVVAVLVVVGAFWLPNQVSAPASKGAEPTDFTSVSLKAEAGHHGSCSLAVQVASTEGARPYVDSLIG
jgi:hypothetical protein